MRIFKTFARGALIAAASIALAGCFDVTQSVAIDRHGAGAYQIALAATGLVGEGLKSGKSNLDVGENKNVQTSTLIANGVTTRTSKIDFRSLSDLSLSADSMSLHVTGHDLFGLGPAHVVFRHSLHVSDARKLEGKKDSDDAAAAAVLAGIFANHFYQFSVTLPGSIDWIAPVKIGDVEVKPTVTGDFYQGHTVTWRLPLADLFETQAVNFSVGFSAWGDFADVRTKPGTKRDS